MAKSSFNAVNNAFNKKRKHDCSPIAIEHKCDINESVTALFQNEELSDVIFVVDGTSFKAHRIILAARSEYFRALLFGGLKESQETQIHLNDIEKSSFKVLLKYMYTGILDAEEVENCIFELVYYSDLYCLTKLHQSLMEHIKRNLTPEFVLKAYEIGKYYSVKDLLEASLDFIQLHAAEVVKNESFNETPLEILMEVLQTDRFFLPEVKVYKALRNYLKFNNYSMSKMKSVVREVIRFPLLTLDQIIEHLHMDGLFDVEECREIVGEKCGNSLKYRYICLKDVNYVINNDKFVVLKGHPVSQIDIASSKIMIIDDGFKRRMAGETVFEFSLGKRCLVNHVRTLAYLQPLKRDIRSTKPNYEFRETMFNIKQMSLSSVERGHDFKYSYDLFVSADNKHWSVVTKSSVLSNLWQCIYFPAKVVKFIRILVTGVDSSLVHAMFHLLHLQCFYSTMNFEFDQHQNLMPHFNVAAAPKIPTFYPGVLNEEYYCVAEFRSPKEIYSLYSSHILFEEDDEEESFRRSYLLFVLSQDCLIDTIVISLFDKDSREYDFKVECGLRENELKTIDSRTKRRSKQVINFEPTVIRFIKIEGTNIHNVHASEFSILNLEVYCGANSNTVSKNVIK